MTPLQNALNLDSWIRKIFPHLKICSIEEDKEYGIVTLGWDKYDIQIMIVDKIYIVLAMSWGYDFKEAEEVIDFINHWKLLEE